MTFETEPVEVTGNIIAKTPDAILLDNDEVQAWLPISQISNHSTDGMWDIGDLVTAEIPEWLAIDRGLA